MCVLALAAAGLAQGAPSGPIAAKFTPGGSVRYEFEGIVHVSTDHAANVKLNWPADCAYRLRAVLKLDFEKAGANGAISGGIHFLGMQPSADECSEAEQTRFSSAIHELEASGTEFQVHSAGDVRLTHPVTATDPEIVSILLKSAWDLLQPRLSDGPVARGSYWSASRRFLYWPDTFVDNMEVAASSMQYTRDVTIGNRTCALLKYKQVFAPTDMPAYVDARSRARDFTGTTYITGRAGVALLWDRNGQRVVYAHRERSINNRLMLKYETSRNSVPLATFAVDEESTVRWLPDENSQEWLAALGEFEAAPGESPGFVGQKAAESSVAALAAASRKKEQGEEHDLSELLNRPPHGFERWGKSFCVNAYCFDLSLAVPEGTREADRTQTTVLLLAGSGERNIAIAVGPMLDQQGSGLRVEELLRQQATRFVGNHLWSARGTGELLNFSTESLDNRPAAFGDFTSTARDLTPTRGRIVIVLAPYGRLVPITCSYAAAQPGLDAVCQTVTDSVVIH